MLGKLRYADNMVNPVVSIEVKERIMCWLCMPISMQRFDEATRHVCTCTPKNCHPEHQYLQEAFDKSPHR
jgi:hypothetical protein